jgi:predicted Ser/Thr protein kinase
MVQTTERFLQIEAIFSEALEAPQELRDDLLAARCGGDLAMIEEVRLLLNGCKAEELRVASDKSAPGRSREDRLKRQRFGPYEIDRLLGRGGTGAVYLAHRADGQFEQKVAVKVIDIPLASELFRERFRQERQILAGLQHPYIARLLDGGITEEGELYLAMEYVDGVPIHRYCDERKLSQAQRIDLFLRACGAVQFAHQNFVVHRDLKPDNILVAGDGTPRLLDFGTAKLLSPSMDKQDSQLTREGYLSFTPQFASPEQVLGNPITTASDTYSLGVLLYLLLTGTLPYELKDLTMGQMMKTVCEEAPRKPSAIAGSGKPLDADLEAILLKALRKEPQERYLTAERLADDLRAYLEGQPVAARRGTARYLAGKFIRRHRWPLAAAALLLITLLAGVAGVAWQARVANLERLKADEERRVAEVERHKAEARSADLRQLSNSLLNELDTAIQQIPGSTGAQELLVKSVLKHLDRMAADAHGDRQTQLDLADGYTRLANIQGNPAQQNLGDFAGALVSVNKAIAMSEPFAGHGSNDREAIHTLAYAQYVRGQILFGTGAMQQAIESTHAAIANFDRMGPVANMTADEIFDMASSYGQLGDELGLNSPGSLNDLPGALAAYQRVIDLTNQGKRNAPNLSDWDRNLYTFEQPIIDIEMEIDPARALKDTQTDLQGVAALSKAQQEDVPMLRVRNMLLLDEASALVQLGKNAEANAFSEEAVQSFKSLSAKDPKDLRALADLNAGLVQTALDYQIEADPDLAPSADDRRRSLMNAEKYLTEELTVLGKLMKQGGGQDQWMPFLGDTKINLGSIRFILHHGDDSTQLVKEGLATYRNLVKSNQAPSAILDAAAQDFLYAEPASLKDPQLAVSCAERAVTLSHRRLPSRLLTLARAYRATGQAEKSRATAIEALALLPAWQTGTAKPRIRKLLDIQTQNSF